MVRALFVGDINVDLIFGGLESLPLVDREITCSSYDITIGSTAAITACAYSNLGGRAYFCGLAGRDAYGKFMLKGLKNHGVSVRYVRFDESTPTGVTVNLIYEATRTQITYPGTIETFDGAAYISKNLRRFGHLHFSGIYLQKKFLPTLPRLLREAFDRGLTISLDTQWDAEERWSFLEEMLPYITYLFMNDEEARSFSGCAAVEKAWIWLAGKTNCPVIKLGVEGCLVRSGGDCPQRIAGHRVEVMDTTGAGDSFAAAFLLATLEHGMSVVQAARFANAAGARSCLFPGGVNARSTYSDITRFMEDGS